MALGDGFTAGEQARWEQEQRDRWAREDLISIWRQQNGIFEVKNSFGEVADSPLYVEYGSWLNSAAKVDFHPYFEGRGTRFLTYNDFDPYTGNPGNDHARITPNWPITGQFEIYAAWPIGANAYNVRYTVKHANGTSVVYIDQISRVNSNQWNSLGIYTFNAGRDELTGSVDVSEEEVTGYPSARWGLRVYVDSFRARIVT